ncbi:aldehyde dehydrogenase [Burkholderia aenigmatica]|uniref:Aldehyde dehydrogenase n=1 Tax=Burkholderia aenigmatica TaxID=2015348 RepID=A0ABY6Y1K5_9BURK|nr:aldehyde dehydrogenase [Burkholderia aenigmatica]VWD58001.1 aldehyde dehydrogenase [Burkholderia aenigmatica]
MGQEVAKVLSQRLARGILELGGNNGMIVAPSADLDLVVRAVTFAAVGTAGQRCTTLRRLIVHRSLVEQLLPRIEKAYTSVKVGNPLEEGTLVGPLVDRASFDAMQKALGDAREQGGEVKGGERVDVGHADAYYVRPAIVRMPKQSAVVERETFAPILYVMVYDNFDDAIELHNAVPQGLSSAIFTNDMREAEQFMSAAGSDCGIVNVNIGTSGAEIGGAFGGEKETGGCSVAVPALCVFGRRNAVSCAWALIGAMGAGDGSMTGGERAGVTRRQTLAPANGSAGLC